MLDAIRAKVKKYFLPFLILMCFFTHAISVTAASLYMTPSSAQPAVGDTVTLRVYVNTQSVSVNTVEGVVKFDPSLLQVVSVNKSNSIVNIWIEEPSFSNSAGTISFNGGMTPPGYTGSSGEIFSITAKMKKEGSTALSLSGISVRKSDGSGADVASSANANGTSLTSKTKVAVEPVVEVKKPVATVAQPLTKPVLVSATHPDQNSWYKSGDVDITWVKNAQAPGAQIVFDSNQNSIAAGPIQYNVTKKSLRGVRDGISYVHVRYVSAAGVSDTAHFAIQVDGIPPEPIKVSTTTEGILIQSFDAHSGIAYADVSIDNASSTRVYPKDGALVFVPAKDLVTGEYSTKIAVVDKAGNSAEFVEKIFINSAPLITFEREKDSVPVGEQMYFKGSVKDSTIPVSIYVRSPSQKIEHFIIDPQADGSFMFDYFAGEEGVYEAWAEITPAVKTKPVEVKTFATLKSQIIGWFTDYGLMLLGVLLLIVAIIQIAMHMCLGKRKNPQDKEIQKLESSAQKSLTELRANAQKQIEYLEKLSQVRELTIGEKETYARCKSMQ